MQNKKIVMFDFDGTIADSEEVLFEVVNELSGEYGFEKIKKAQIPELKKLNLSKLMEKFGVSWIRLPFILSRARKMFRKRIGEVLPIEGMKETLEELDRRGYQIIIVTTNKKQTVEEFLRDNGICCVKKVFGVFNLRGKARALKKVCKNEGLDVENVFYVGDEIRDIEAAKKAGMKSIAVAWGFNSKDALEKNNPDCMIDNPDELLGILR